MIDQVSTQTASSPNPRLPRSRNRRGTVLLLVVGVLALLAIIAVVYATLGSADRSASSAVVRKVELNTQVETLAEYLSGVIGASTFAVYPEPTLDVGSNGLRTQMPRIRGNTYPGVDRFFTSIPVGDVANVANPPPQLTTPSLRVDGFDLFNTSGSLTKRWPHAAYGTADQRLHADPWLADIEARSIERWSTLPGSLFPLGFFRDWGNISNIAPSGNFVNLANLRSDRGGFASRSGFELNEMSFGLTLFDPATGRPQDHTAPQRLNSIGSAQANLLLPRDWSADQQWAHRPMVADAQTSTGIPITASSHEYLFNQWADADGDGMADSRWAELVDISRAYDRNNPRVTSLIPINSGFRLFIAARVIDNSARVNVNTAGDLASPTIPFGPADVSLSLRPVLPAVIRSGGIPTTADQVGTSRDDAYPLGLTPADVDLRRLLGVSDYTTDLGIPPGGSLQGYQGIVQPQAANDPGDFRLYSRDAALRIGSRAYAGVQETRRRGVPPSSTIEQTNFNRAAPSEYVSAKARLVDYMGFGSPGTGTSSALQHNPDARYTTVPESRAVTGAFGLSDEQEILSFFGVNDSSVTSKLEQAMTGRWQNAGQNITLSFGPMRDSRPTALETDFRSELTGPDLFNISNPDAQAVLLGIFTDVRRFLTTTSGARPIKDGGVAAAASTVATLRLRPDVTTLLTRLRLNTFDNGIALAALPNGVPASDAGRSASASDERIASLQGLYELYSDVLLPYSSRTLFFDAWNQNNAPNPSLSSQGLSYGGRAELAMRMAAAMSINLADMIDFDRRQVASGTAVNAPPPDLNQPTAISLQLSQNLGSDLSGSSLRPIDSSNIASAQYPWVNEHVWATSNVMKLADDRLPEFPSQLALNSQSGMVNMFGVEPQPFLIEAGAMAVFCDVGIAGVFAPGDDESTNPVVSGPPPVPGAPPQPTEITINWSPELSNRDFLGELLFFRLTNPFDQDVVLARLHSTGEIEQLYYLEYANRYFSLVPQAFNTFEFDRSAFSVGTNDGILKLRPGETRTFVVINPGTQGMLQDRLCNARNSSSTVGAVSCDSLVQQMLDNQFGAGKYSVVAMIYPEQMTVIPDAAHGTAVPFGSASTTQIAVDLFGQSGILPAGTTRVPSGDGIQAATTENRRAVMLWRVMRPVSTFSTGIYFDDRDWRSNNCLANDLLADKLRDPSPVTDAINGPGGYLWGMRSSLPVGAGSGAGDAVLNTVARKDGVAGTAALPNDNESPSVYVTWAHIFRPGDAIESPTSSGTSAGKPAPRSRYLIEETGSINGKPRAGILPPWCMELKLDALEPDPARPGITSLNGGANKILPEPGRPALNGLQSRLEVTDLGTLPESATSIATWLDRSTVANEQDKSVIYATSVSPYSSAWGTFDSSLTDRLGFPRQTARQLAVIPQPRAVARVQSGTVVPKSYSDVAVEFHTVGSDILVADASVSPPSPVSIGGRTVYRIVSRNPAMFSRPGDFLLPLAIAPMNDPNGFYPAPRQIVSGVDNRLTEFDKQWFTLSEMIALASGYYVPDPSLPGNQLWGGAVADESFASELWNAEPIARAKTDRGHLRLDAFTPFTIIDGVTQPMGAGVPLALGALDQFRSAYGVSSSLDVPAGPGTPGTQFQFEVASPNSFFYTGLSSSGAPGGGTAQVASVRVDVGSDLTINFFSARGASTSRLIPGAINVNTATTRVLRTLPLLAPERENPGILPVPPALGDDFLAQGPWLSRINPPSPAATILPTLWSGSRLFDNRTANLRGWDLAQTIVSYRDKLNVLPQRPLNDYIGASVSATLPSFEDNVSGRSAVLGLNAPAGGLPINRVRETRGFKSIGELAAINLRDTAQARTNGGDLVPGGATPGVTDGYMNNVDNSMFKLAVGSDVTLSGTRWLLPALTNYPGLNAGRFVRRTETGEGIGEKISTTVPASIGIVSQEPPDVTGSSAVRNNVVVTPLIGSEVTGAYQDKLTIINSIANTISTRSDVFTVYFVLHGYTPEDTQVESFDQPMLPTLAKRFVMVVDRSNVVSSGDKPKILMLKELPIR